MKVNFYATLRLVTGAKTVDVPLPDGATVGKLLEVVLERFPAMREDLLDEEDKLYGHVHLFVNGRDAPYLEHGLDTPLGADDAVDLFPAIGGG